jgi:GTP-binding protein
MHGPEEEEEREPLILAEIPGLIPGAHEGKGLGDRFLRHLRRTRLLLEVVDLSRIEPERPLAPLEELEQEMRAFDPDLLDKPRLLVLTKTDLLTPDFPRTVVLAAYQQTGRRVLCVSARSGEGLPELRRALWEEFTAHDHETLETAVSE